MKQFLKDFRDFAVKGNVFDMAIGIIIGAAFTAIVTSLVQNVFTPVIGLITGGVNFTDMFVTLRNGSTPGPYPTLAAAQHAGAVTMNIGLFLNAVISFILVALVCFLLVRTIARMKRKQTEQAEAAAAEKAREDAAKVKTCTYCFSEIPVQATRCPDCTSELKSAT